MRVEADDDGGGNENASRVQRSCALNVAGIERQGNAGNSASGLFASATILGEESLDVDSSLKWVPRVEADRDAGRSTFDLGIALDSVVDGNCDGGGHQGQKETNFRQHSAERIERNEKYFSP